MRNWDGEKLYDLFTMNISEFIEKYGLSKKYVQAQKNKLTKLIIEKITLMEKITNPEERDNIQRLKEILKDFSQHGLPISPEDAENVSKINMWQTTTVIDGEIVQELNRQVELKSTSGTETDVIRQAPSLIIKPAKVTRLKSKDKMAIIVPDLQAGYRRMGEVLEPIHDENVVDIGLQIIRHSQPDLIVLNGDNLDFPDLSHFQADSLHFQQVMQTTIDRLYMILGEMRASSPDSRIVWLEGNHEKRLAKSILKHNLPLWGVRRPSHKDDYSWLSIPHLMDLNEVGVEYVPGYPANRFLINDRLQVIHGDKVRSGSSTAALYTKEEDISTLFGHVHRMEGHSRTLRRSGKVITAMSFGTWARVDGAVPSYGNAVDDEGNVVQRYEDWQNGLGVIQYQEGDKPWQGQPVHIDHNENYETNYNGKRFTLDGTRTF